jgi:hypothetical protein
MAVCMHSSTATPTPSSYRNVLHNNMQGSRTLKYKQ